MMVVLSEKQAYAAMFFFLRDMYDRAKSDEIGALLGALSLLPDGGSADPAMQEDWKKAVSCALTTDVPNLF